MILGQPQIERISSEMWSPARHQVILHIHTTVKLSKWTLLKIEQWMIRLLDPTQLWEQDGPTKILLSLFHFPHITRVKRGIVFGVCNKPIAGVGMPKTIGGLFYLVLNGWLHCILRCPDLRVHRPRQSAVIHVFTQTQIYFKDKMSLLSKRTFGLLRNMDQSINSSLLHLD